MLNLKETEQINKQIDAVITYGTDYALGWLRGAFHTHENSINSLKEKLKELRELHIKDKEGSPLTVREAQLCNVCRYCKSKFLAMDQKGYFLLNFGEEFAHEGCIKTNKKVWSSYEI